MSRRKELIETIEKNLSKKKKHIIYVPSRARTTYKEIQDLRNAAKKFIGCRCRFIPFRKKEVLYGTIVGILWDRTQQDLFFRIRPDGQKKTLVKKLFSTEMEIL